MSVPSQQIALTPATLAVLLRHVVAMLPHVPGMSPAALAEERQAAIETVALLHPRDQTEAMLVARIIAAHAHVMNNFRCAGLPDMPAAMQLRYQTRAIALSRVADQLDKTLKQHQSRALETPAVLPAAAVQAALAAPPKVAEPTRQEVPRAAGAPQRKDPAPRQDAATPRPAGRAAVDAEVALQERILNDLAGRVATSATALAA